MNADKRHPLLTATKTLRVLPELLSAGSTSRSPFLNSSKAVAAILQWLLDCKSPAGQKRSAACTEERGRSKRAWNVVSRGLHCVLQNCQDFSRADVHCGFRKRPRTPTFPKRWRPWNHLEIQFSKEAKRKRNRKGRREENSSSQFRLHPFLCQY